MPKWMTFAFAIFLSLQVFSTSGQTYFDFFYTNIPEEKFEDYNATYSSGLDWLQTGNYTLRLPCSTCPGNLRNSTLKKPALDSLILLYRTGGFKNIYQKRYIPGNTYFVADEAVALPYIIKTLYRIEVRKPIPIFQVKMTFYERPDTSPGIAGIEILDVKTMKMYDSKMVIDSYRQIHAIQ